MGMGMPPLEWGTGRWEGSPLADGGTLMGLDQDIKRVVVTVQCVIRCSMSDGTP